jgi:protein ImuB
MQSASRRIAAVFFPLIACEIARAMGRAREGAPLAVVFVEEASADASPSAGTAEVGAVCDAARARGVRPGMRVAQAAACAADLQFANVTMAAVARALGAAAEVAMEFGPTVEVQLPGTVWIDVTGAAHLFGGEDALVREATARMAVLGHRAQVAVAAGPLVAQALARFGAHADVPRVVGSSPGDAARSLAPLPVAALPIEARAASRSSPATSAACYFAKLGVLTIADLARLDRAQLASRLEAFVEPGVSRATVKDILALLEGRDARPLVPYRPPNVLVEEIAFDDGVETAPQLVFALRHAVSKLSARLVGRRQASSRIDLVVGYDAAIHRLRRGAGDGPQLESEASARLFVDLPAPLSHTDDLFRAIKVKIERFELAAPAVHLTLVLSRIGRAPEVQLDLSRDAAVDPDALPALLSELSAEIGAERVGVLMVADDHRPEHRSRLVGLREEATSAAAPALAPEDPTRLLPAPVPIGRFAPGAVVVVGSEAFVVLGSVFDRRLDGVAWWSKEPASRDYFRVLLRAGAEACAWVYVDRSSGDTMLHGWWE